MKVSVITPCNRIQDMPRIQEIFSKQTYSEAWHIIVCASYEIENEVKRIGHTASVIYENASIAQMLNAAIDSSIDDIIIRMDSDDYYSPFYIKHIVETLMKHDNSTLVGLSNCFFYDELTNNAWEYKWDDISQRLVVGASHAFYRDCRFKYPDDLDRAWGEDNLFCTQFPKVVYGDYKEHFVAIKHGRNTSPYNFRDGCYEPANAEYVRSLMK